MFMGKDRSLPKSPSFFLDFHSTEFALS
jgi:hypothetical protein